MVAEATFLDPRLLWGPASLILGAGEPQHQHQLAECRLRPLAPRWELRLCEEIWLVTDGARPELRRLDSLERGDFHLSKPLPNTCFDLRTFFHLPFLSTPSLSTPPL
jgi:hypothetical protein